MKKFQICFLLFFGFLVGGIVCLYIFSVCRDVLPARSTFGAFPIIDGESVQEGYTLLSPYQTTDQKGKVYLVDMVGNVVHSWETKNQPFHATLNKNGHLLVAEITSFGTSSPPSGSSGTIAELDWNGKVVWEYKNKLLHHDFEMLPNGNLLAIVWERVSSEKAETVVGGVAGTELQGAMWSDAIIEVNRQGKIVWKWSAQDHLDGNEDTLGPLWPRSEWTHANTVKYLLHNPIDGSEGYLVSFAYINRVVIIRKKDGALLWKSPNTIFANQHDPSLLLNGNILLFDNGFYKKANPEPVPYSRVLEISPKNNKVVWKFIGGKGMEGVMLSSGIAGGAQRLANGNTLITESTKGRILEVTWYNKVVWDFVNPYVASVGPLPANFIFKARRYTQHEITWPEHLPPAVPLFPKMCTRLFF